MGTEIKRNKCWKHSAGQIAFMKWKETEINLQVKYPLSEDVSFKF